MLKNRKSEFDGILDDEEDFSEDSSHPIHIELVGENNVSDFLIHITCHTSQIDLFRIASSKQKLC